MNAAAPKAIFAMFSDFKTVKTRKCLQLIFEVPFEHNKANEAIDALGGVPNPAYPQWVGIAPVTTEHASEPPQPLAEPSADRGKLLPPRKERTPWPDCTPTFQAAVRCTEPRFWRFLRSQGWTCNSETDAASIVREICGVDSRRNITVGSKASEAWRHKEAEYQAHCATEQYAEHVR